MLHHRRPARRPASRRQLGIPHYIVNFERQFDETVVSNFVREYASGRTPIPCVHCNGDLKFATLAARAEGLGARLVATGHYARVEEAEAGGPYLLKRGVDPAKDQSYFLFTLTQDQLSHALFPVGALDKTAVRALARELDLAVSEKPDSHEICFVADGDHDAFLESPRRGPRPPAPSATPPAASSARTTACTASRSDSERAWDCRRGFASTSWTSTPAKARSQSDHGRRSSVSALTASGVNWIAGAPPPPGSRGTAQIRHRHREAAVTIHPQDGDRVSVEFDEPQYAVTPGQAVVLYDGEMFWVGAGSTRYVLRATGATVQRAQHVLRATCSCRCDVLGVHIRHVAHEHIDVLSTCSAP